MSITKNSGRQEKVVAYVDVALANLVSGAAAAAIDLPIGAIVLGGHVVVTTAFDGETSDSLDVGDASDANRFSATPIDLQVAALTDLDVTGFVATKDEPSVTVTWTGVGAAPTVGAFRLVVEYMVEKRAAFSQG